MLGRIANIFQRSAHVNAPGLLLEPADYVWALGSLCALNNVPFDAELLLKQFPPPYTTDSLIYAARALGFRIKFQRRNAAAIGEVATPCVVLLTPPRAPAGEPDETQTPPPEADRNQQAGLGESGDA